MPHVPPGRRLDRRPHAHPACATERRLHRARPLQRALHDPRRHDGLPGRGADPRRLRQLHGAADDRGAGHGLPAAERTVVLALPVRRNRPLHELFCEGRARQDGLDDLPPAVGSPGRRGRRPPHSFPAHPLDRLARGRDQLPGDHPPHAHAWDDVDAPAALRLVDRGLRRIARRRAAGALSGADDAAPRPAGRHTLLPARGGRERRPLPARLLVLRAPRGLHHDPARDGDHLRGDPRLRAQADLRVHGDRPVHRRDRLLLPPRVGAPHVHGRALERACSGSSWSPR